MNKTPSLPLTLSALLLFSTVLLPLGIAALTPRLPPYNAKFPGPHTLDQPGGEVPTMAKAFAPFRETLGISWDENFLYLEGDGLPDHPMMRGIVAWQQQVPLPQDFTGPNRFKLPLKPVILEQPQELTRLGPIAISVNGIPIFHSLTQSGKDAYAGGELDEWGGHCGRADDYHYHIAPAHLAEIVGKGAPVAFGLDGHPVYLENPEKDETLDECHGYFDESGNYRYVGNLTAPYMMSYFRGSADLEERPKTRPLRPALPPLRGAKITGFEGSLETGYSLKYEIDGRQGSVSYRLGSDAVDFRFDEPDGRVTEESYPLSGGGKGGPKGGKSGERRAPAPAKAEANQSRSPWILVHAKEIDANGDGFVDLEGELDDPKETKRAKDPVPRPF